MSALLPNGNLAIIDLRKIADYCLIDTHPRGRHKARMFRSALGIRGDDAAWLRDVLLEAVRTIEAQRVETDSWGDQWRLDMAVKRHGRSAVARTVWMVRAGEAFPRSISGWVLE
jgi:hypothetical protein